MLIIAIQIQDCSVPLISGVSVSIPSLPCEHLGGEWGEAIRPLFLGSLALDHKAWQCGQDPTTLAVRATGRAWFLVWFCPSWGLTGTTAQMI